MTKSSEVRARRSLSARGSQQKPRTPKHSSVRGKHWGANQNTPGLFYFIFFLLCPCMVSDWGWGALPPVRTDRQLMQHWEEVAFASVLFSEQSESQLAAFSVEREGIFF